MKKCPFCAEEIQDEAIKCKHCLSMLDNHQEESQKTRGDKLIAAGEALKTVGNNMSRIGCGLTFLFTFPILGFAFGGIVGLVFGLVLGLVCLAAMFGTKK